MPCHCSCVAGTSVTRLAAAFDHRPPLTYALSLPPSSNTHAHAHAHTRLNRNVLQTLKVLLSEGGARGLWRGTGPTVVRLAFGAGINFVALENLKHFMLDVLPQSSGQLGYLQAAAVGGEEEGAEVEEEGSCGCCVLLAQ